MAECTMEKLKSLFDDVDFYEELNDTSFYEYVYPKIKENFRNSGLEGSLSATEGASKIVLLFSKYDWVLKIPKTATGKIYSKNCCSCQCARCNSCSGGESDLSELFLADNGFNDWDYCLTELINYELAYREGIEDAFLEVRFLGNCGDGYPIYMQKKADVCGLGHANYIGDSLSEEELNKKKTSAKEILNHDDFFLSETALVYFIINHGKKLAEKLVRFLEKYDINDLHYYNIGVRNNHIVLFDYSGFRDCNL